MSTAHFFRSWKPLFWKLFFCSLITYDHAVLYNTRLTIFKILQIIWYAFGFGSVSPYRNSSGSAELQGIARKEPQKHETHAPQVSPYLGGDRHLERWWYPAPACQWAEAHWLEHVHHTEQWRSVDAWVGTIYIPRSPAVSWDWANIGFATFCKSLHDTWKKMEEDRRLLSSREDYSSGCLQAGALEHRDNLSPSNRLHPKTCTQRH